MDHSEMTSKSTVLHIMKTLTSGISKIVSGEESAMTWTMVLKDIRTLVDQSDTETGLRTETVEELVTTLIRRYRMKEGEGKMQQKEDIIAALERHGIFRMRGGVPATAAALGVSRYTVYNYLHKRRGEHRAWEGEK